MACTDRRDIRIFKCLQCMQGIHNSKFQQVLFLFFHDGWIELVEVDKKMYVSELKNKLLVFVCVYVCEFDSLLERTQQQKRTEERNEMILTTTKRRGDCMYIYLKYIYAIAVIVTIHHARTE